MPSFELTGPERVYPYHRDVNGRPLGVVQPGDIRMFDEAPDSWWVPVIPPRDDETASEEPASGEASVWLGTGVEMHGVEHPADGTWSPPVSNDPPSGPQPAPPAVVAPPAGPAFAVTTGQQ